MSTTNPPTELEARMLALKIAAEKTGHHADTDVLLANAKKLLAFLLGSESKD